MNVEHNTFNELLEELERFIYDYFAGCSA